MNEVEALRAIVKELQQMNQTLARMAPQPASGTQVACCDDPQHEPLGFGSTSWICRHCGKQGVIY